MDQELESFVNLLNKNRGPRPVTNELAHLPNWAQRALSKIPEPATPRKPTPLNGTTTETKPVPVVGSSIEVPPAALSPLDAMPIPPSSPAPITEIAATSTEAAAPIVVAVPEPVVAMARKPAAPVAEKIDFAPATREQLHAVPALAEMFSMPLSLDLGAVDTHEPAPIPVEAIAELSDSFDVPIAAPPAVTPDIAPIVAPEAEAEIEAETELVALPARRRPVAYVLAAAAVIAFVALVTGGYWYASQLRPSLASLDVMPALKAPPTHVDKALAPVPVTTVKADPPRPAHAPPDGVSLSGSAAIAPIVERVPDPTHAATPLTANATKPEKSDNVVKVATAAPPQLAPKPTQLANAEPKATDATPVKPVPSTPSVKPAPVAQQMAAPATEKSAPILVATPTKRPSPAPAPESAPKLALVTPAIQPAASAKPVEAKPAGAKPAGAKPVETKPVETKPAAAKPVAPSSSPQPDVAGKPATSPPVVASKPPAPTPIAAPTAPKEPPQQLAMLTPPAPRTPAAPVVAKTAAPPSTPPSNVEQPTWMRNALPAPPFTGQPQIAIVLDDLGLDRSRTQRAIALDGPVTLSFLAYASDLPQQTEAARRAGHELIVHVPMEPIMRPKLVSSANGAGAMHDELLRRLRWDLNRFTGYVGVNNHMGNRLATDPEAAQTVIAELKARGLLFLDSRGAAGGAGAIAERVGVPTVFRDIFLDDDISASSINERLAALERTARERGTAVAIGHPHDQTLAALTVWLASLPGKGLQLVPLTAIVKHREQHVAGAN